MLKFMRCSRKMSKISKLELKDVISNKSLIIIDRRDKEIMVAAMHKMVNDLDKLQKMFSEIDLTPDQLNRLYQFISANKMRGKKVIWGLTISRIRDSKNQKMYESLELKKENVVESNGI